MTHARRVGLVATCGLLAAVVVAIASGEAMGRTAYLVGVSAGAGLLVLVAVQGVLTGPVADAQRLGLRARAVVVALVPVVAVAVGALAAARAMFVSPDDLRSLVVIITGAGTIGLVGALGMARDLERARADAEAASERERALERSRRELVAWVSHDLRTPLAGIRAMVEALDDGVVDDRPTVERYHALLLQETDRLARLVDDLFELSRIQTDPHRPALDHVSVGEIVASALDSTEAVARAKSVTVTADLDPPAVPVVASAPELGRVVRNLLDNAVRHTPAGGTVVVDVGTDDDHAVVTVTDQCGGIAIDDLDHVFDVAYRGDDARSPSPGQGGGLGLAIARGLTEAHHGQISVRNHDDGCCFTVRLPLAR
jgi:signal transduction histidine kinase